MNHRLIICFLVACALLAPDIVHADTNKEKLDDIRRLLHLTDSGKMSIEVMKKVIFSYKKTAPEVPESFWMAVEGEIEKDAYVDLLVPIYNKYLTHEDIKALLEFYNTDTGKKILSVQPEIVKESIDAGEVWGDQISEIIKNKLAGMLPEP